MFNRCVIQLSVGLKYFRRRSFLTRCTKMAQGSSCVIGFNSNSSTQPKIKFEELNRIPWIDLEMTGLDVQKDHILEIASVVTDQNLNIIAQGPNLVIHQPKEILDNMDEWCIKNHAKTGLTQACLNSKITTQQAEIETINFLKQHISEGCCPLAGNSIYIDRQFLQHEMPLLNNLFHYRILDVSTVKEICKRWNRDIYEKMPPKKMCHRALDDILESINELRYYRSTLFKLK